VRNAFLEPSSAGCTIHHDRIHIASVEEGQVLSNVREGFPPGAAKEDGYCTAHLILGYYHLNAQCSEDLDYAEPNVFIDKIRCAADEIEDSSRSFSLGWDHFTHSPAERPLIEGGKATHRDPAKLPIDVQGNDEEPLAESSDSGA
jgi:hypothetical protein